MVVDNCTFAGNVKAGLEVRENGILTVRNSRMYNNATQGLTIGPRTAKCDAFDCQIYHNDQEGIAALDESKRITLIRNEIFGNDYYGIYARNSEIDMRENKVFGNEAWGIWSQTNTLCKVSMNEVFRNKRGGIRVGKRRTGRKFPPSVVELNTVHDNFGPEIVDTINIFDGFLGNDCQSAKKMKMLSTITKKQLSLTNRNFLRLGVLGATASVTISNRVASASLPGIATEIVKINTGQNTRNCAKFYVRNPAS